MKQRLITHNGITLNELGWAKKLGINSATISARLARGWSESDALTAPPNRVYATNKGDDVVTKSMAEADLNDIPLSQLPQELRKLLPNSYQGNKHGRYIRNGHRQVFDQWYDKSFGGKAG